MKNKVILFSHHYFDNYIIEKIKNIEHLNPSWDVIPIGFKEHTLLSNSLIVNDDKYPKNDNIQYHVDRKSVV